MEHHILTMRGAAHDIRGYLASASLATEHLIEHEDCRIAIRAERIAKAIDQVVSICQTDLAGVNPTNTMARLNASDIKALLEQIALLLGARSEGPFDRFEVSVSVAADVELNCHQEHLFRVIYNLAINAARAISDHGGTRVDLRVITANRNIMFFVCDDGPGLPHHITDHLYPRINRPASSEKRIGFGLMSAVMLAKEMGGHLQLVHTSDRGTEFCLTLSASAR